MVNHIFKDILVMVICGLSDECTLVEVLRNVSAYIALSLSMAAYDGP